MKRLTDSWKHLTEPDPSVRDLEARHKSRFLASLLLTMVPIGLATLIAAEMLVYSFGFLWDNDFHSLLGGSVLWAIAYRLARKGRYRAGTMLAMGAGVLAIFLGAVLDNDGGMGELSFMIFPILLASLIFSVRGTALLAGASLITTLLAPVVNPAASFLDVVVGPVIFLVIGFVFILIANRHRDILEGARRSELARSNALVNALSKVAAQLAASAAPEEIFHILGRELQELGLQNAVTTYNETTRSYQVAYISLAEEVLNSVHKLARLDFRSIFIQPDRWLQNDAILTEDREPVFIQNFAEFASGLLPETLQKRMQGVLLLVAIAPETAGVLLPLVVGKQFTGTISVWGDTLAESDLPAFMVFASQVANAFEQARLYNRARDEIRYRQKVQTDLERSREEYRGLFENAHDAILIVDSVGGQILDVNQRACEVYGYQRDEMLGMDLGSLSPDLERWDEHMRRTLSSGSFHHFEAVQRRSDGRRMDLEVNASVVDYMGRKAVQLINRDVTARKQHESRLVHDALHDSLTDLPNRDLFVERLQHAMARSDRYTSGQFAVLYIDLDQFKKINDSLGHLVGDQFLVEIGHRLRHTVRGSDLVARLGGDEFAVLLEEMDSPGRAVEFCRRLKTILVEPVTLNSHELVVSASIGIVVSSPRYQSSDEYLRDADIAMYRAKAVGPGRYAVFDASMHAEVLRKLSMEGKLRHAVSNKEFDLLYQPIMALDSGTVLGHEALVRWRPSQGEVVRPSQFIPVAEETGLIHDIGRKVLEEACRQYLEWMEERPESASQRISVNVSGMQLLQANFVDEVAEILEETGMPANFLTLEMTESALITEIVAVESALHRLHELGIRIHLDDFGTGFSSLSFLARFPIQAIKIDRRFIMELDSGNNWGLVRSIVSLGKDLDLQVIAEGIETASQIEALRSMGCLAGQGYYFSRPRPAAEILRRRLSVG